MATLTDLVAVALLAVYLSSLQSDCFRIRRSGLSGFNDPYALSNAYPDLERRRRRTDYGPLLLNDEDAYFNPKSVMRDIDDSDRYLMGSPYEGDSDDMPVYFPDYRFKSSFQPYRSIKDDPFQYGELEQPVYTPQKRMSHKSHAFKRMGTSNMNELRKIFASADVPEKRLAPVKRREPSIEHSKSLDKSSSAEQTRELVKKVREILQTAEKITRAQAEEEDAEDDDEPNVIKDVVVEKISPDGNSVVKQEEIVETNDFEGDDVQDAAEVDNSDINTAEDVIDAANGEEVAETSDDAEKSQSKSKRASSQYDNEGYVQDLEEEVESLRNEVIRLQLLQILEDKENDYLANALKYATLDQLRGDDRLVMKEYDDISKATETEELIQQISNEEDEADAEDAAEEFLEQNSDKDGDDDVIKRSDDLTPDDDGWMDGPVQESVSYGASIKDEDTDKGEFPIDIPYSDEDEDNKADDLEDEAIKEVTDVVNQELAEAGNRQAQKDLLQQLLQGLSKSELEELIEELKEIEDVSNKEEEDESSEGVCVPVLELSQNCAFADSLGIPIDQEARGLCSRHQMCNTCGASLGISQLGCNDGYKGEVIDACKDDDKCIRQSAIFLRLMERYHKYESYSPDECSNACVEDFIFGKE